MRIAGCTGKEKNDGIVFIPVTPVTQPAIWEEYFLHIYCIMIEYNMVRTTICYEVF